MTLVASPALALPLPQLAILFNRAFEGYIGGTIAFDAPAFGTFLCNEGIDLNLSHIAQRDDEVVGFVFISRRGWTSRVAAMGIVPEAKEQGVGRWLLSELVSQATARGDHTMVLECFEQNTPAVRLYEGLGFRVVRRLYGYSAHAPIGNADSELELEDIWQVARMVTMHATTLPWQLDGPTLSKIGPPNLGFRLGQAHAVISDPTRDIVAIRALIVPPDAQRQGQGTRLLQALFARYPNKTWRVPALCPEECQPRFWERLGFTREPLNQFQMERDLTL